MKKLLCGALCAALVLSLALSGCARRAAAPEPAESISESAPEPSSAPPEPEEPEPSGPEEAPGEDYPLPELSDADLKMITQDLNQFLNYFGDLGSLPSAKELDSERALFFCQMEAFRQKDLLGYFYEQDDKGNYLIPDVVVADLAERLLGLEDFSFTGSPRYDPETQAYGYTLGYEAILQNFATSEPKGTADGGVAYDVDFFEEGDTSFLTPVRSSLFTFRFARMNGMPYLRLVSIEPKTK